MVLRDGSGSVQGVLSKKEVAGSRPGPRSAALTQEASVAVTGMVRDDPRSPGGVRARGHRRSSCSGASPDYPDHPQRAWDDVPLRASTPLAPEPPPGRRSPGCGTRSSRRSATSSTSEASPWSIRRSSPAPSARRRATCSPPTTSTWARPTWPRPASSTSRRRPRRSARSTASAPPSGPRSRRPAAT